jgi:dihydrofolate reductase
MRKVIVTNIVSLDGYYEGPGADVMALPMDSAFNEYNLERMQAASTVLLGRRSFELFSSYWPSIADAPEDPTNPALDATNREISRVYNGRSKVVVTDSYTPPPDNAWRDTTTTISSRGVRDWIAGRDEDEEVVVYGSRTMWNGLLHAGLVAELHLMVGPVALGGGTPIFTRPVPPMRLVGTRTFEGSSNVLLRYAPDRD